MKIRRKHIGSKKYFYLEHSIRERTKVVKKELYLGSEIPANIEDMKNNFVCDILKEKYFNRDNYYNALEKAQVQKRERIFVLHIFKRYLKEYQKYT